MQNNPKPFEIYKHFKGNLYQVISIAEHSENAEKMVVYQALYGDYKLYVRPYDMFIGKVEKDKYPDIKQEYRFELQDKETESILEYAATKNVTDIPSSTIHLSEKSVESNDEFKLAPLLQEFLDADTYEERLNILVFYHNQITQDNINTIAAALDIEVKDGDLEDRYEEVKNCLITFEKFECNRLR